MAEHIYLSKELKQYYMIDFEKLLTYNGSIFWQLDEGLNRILSQINSCPDVQTLFSKKFTINPDSLPIFCESYLEIAYGEKSYSKIKQKLDYVKMSTICKDSEVTIFEKEPCDNPLYQANSSIDIGCKTNMDYFRIKHFKIQIESIDKKCHELFWENINSAFAELS